MESCSLSLAEEMRKNYGSDFKHIVMAVMPGITVLSVTG